MQLNFYMNLEYLYKSNKLKLILFSISFIPLYIIHEFKDFTPNEN